MVVIMILSANTTLLLDRLMSDMFHTNCEALVYKKILTTYLPAQDVGLMANATVQQGSFFLLGA